MSDRILVMNRGQAQQVGEPREIYESPVNEFVARFIGEINVFDAAIVRVKENNHYTALLNGLERDIISEYPFAEGDAVKVLLRPEDLRIEYYEDAPEKPGFIGRIVERNYKGSTLDSVIQLDSGQQLLASEFFDEDDPDFDYRLNQKVWIDWVHGWEHVIKAEQ